jgi:hypothetical protein
MIEDAFINEAAGWLARVGGDEVYRVGMVLAMRQGTEDCGPCFVNLDDLGNPELGKDGPWRKGKCNCLLSPPKQLHTLCSTCNLEVIF